MPDVLKSFRPETDSRLVLRWKTVMATLLAIAALLATYQAVWLLYEGWRDANAFDAFDLSIAAMFALPMLGCAAGFGWTARRLVRR
jgi:hypothetical protein